ncbi:2-methoxy-6-polyprenyl-1,4-benzoquinol methylase, mitochondrial [Candidatus Entotheonellaceae bacterium PAL068K]
MIVVDPDWWKTLFDEIYLLTDAEIVCNPPLTRREIDVAEQLLHLRPCDRILDLCGGQGRHSLELARRGYRHLTVLDYNMFLTQHGRSEAAQENLRVHFCRGDARTASLRSASFDVVLLMGMSFGYFVDVADDRHILAEVERVLKPGGRFLLDVSDYDHMRDHFLPESWHEATADIVVCWRRELSDDVIRVREMVLSKSKGLLRNRTYAERLYHSEHLRTLLLEAGLVRSTFYPNAFVFDPEDGMDYGIATHRTLVIATKACPPNHV